MSVTQEDAWVIDALGFDPSKYAKAAPDGGNPEEGEEDDAFEDAGPGGFKSVLGKLLGGDAKPKVAAASEPGEGPGWAQHPVLGTAQQGRAAALLEKMSKKEQKQFAAILKKAKTAEEKQYVTKSLAAGHSLDEVKAFAAKIAGKDAEWMQDNLSLTGSSSGTGVQQQWSHSCNATTVEAVKGELDPIYALKVHEDNPNMGEVDATDATKKNPNLAADQKAMLESTYHGAAAKDHAGVAKARGATGGRGRWADDMLNAMQDVTGLTYETKKIGKGATTDDAISELTANTATGTPVPIVIGNREGAYTHYVLVTASDPGPPRTFAIHDPWSGETKIRTEKQIKDGTLDIAGSNKITAFEKPTPVAVK